MEFLVAIVIIGVVIALIMGGGNVWEKEFASLPPAARSAFLAQAFGISGKDCSRMHFDGRVFHHSKEIPYEKYSRVRVERSERTTVRNSSLPHYVSWRYQRADGGPDRRYRGNVKTMHSERHYVRFEGEEPFILHVYSYPGTNEVDLMVDKFERFLCGAQEHDYESAYAAFESAFEKKLSLQARLKQIDSAISSCDAVTNAQARLADTALPDELKKNVENAAARRKDLAADAEHLHRDLLEQGKREILAINAAQARAEIAVSCRTIASFS